MNILGLQGSPRKMGNSHALISMFLARAEEKGASIQHVHVPGIKITPCKGCGYCEKKGVCVIDDDQMTGEIYALLRQADLIVLASPVFFYGVSGQIKLLIDRTQALWARKYVFKQKDPKGFHRKGFTLSVGASRGKQLFDGVKLTAKYFFDAADAVSEGGLFYKGIESKGAIKTHPGIDADVDRAVDQLMRPFKEKKKVLFVSEKGAFKSVMAAGFAGIASGGSIMAEHCGIHPHERIDPDAVAIMAEMGIDLLYQHPGTIEKISFKNPPDLIIDIDSKGVDHLFPETQRVKWQMPSLDSATSQEEKIRIWDTIQQKVTELIKQF